MTTDEYFLAVSAPVNERIQTEATWTNKSWSEVIIKAIKAAYYVKNQLDADRIIYQDYVPLDFPPPPQAQKPAEANTFKVQLTPHLRAALKKVSDDCGAPPYCVVDWGIDCMNILYDAKLLSKKVYAKKTGEKQVIPCDI